MIVYEPEDYLLIRNDKVIAVSGNVEFTDGDNPVEPQEQDTIARVTTLADWFYVNPNRYVAYFYKLGDSNE